MNQQKIWVINEENRSLSKARTPKPAVELSDADSATRQNPAWSFSLALLVPGSGHVYLGDRRRGLWFMGGTLAVATAIIALVYGRETVYRTLASSPEPASLFVVSFLVLSLVGLVLWLANAVDAFSRGMRRRREAYPGLEHVLLPLGCSLILPGWGQFLNGQLKKGLSFLVLTAAGFLVLETLLVGFYFWPLIEPGSFRGLVDWLLAGLLLLAPLAPLLWLVAAYDAYMTAQSLVRQRYSRVKPGAWSGEAGGGRMLVPRTSAVLSLLLALSLGMQFVPADYYAKTLNDVTAWMYAERLEHSPALLAKANDLLNH